VLAVSWVPIAAWIAALVIALVVLGFCAFEILWKARRLRADIAGLQSVSAQLDELTHELDTTQQRLAAARIV
jgi:hypothetical protein